jgi:hypothetical protein
VRLAAVFGDAGDVRRWPGADLIAALVLASLCWLSSVAAFAQSEDGATMTVLRGQVAVVRGDGSAVQPAPSGTIVHAGD